MQVACRADAASRLQRSFGPQKARASGWQRRVRRQQRSAASWNGNSL